MANLAFTIIDIRQRVKRCTSSGDGYSACCPAHDDNNPSFSFAVKNDRVVFHCAAGCSPDSIVAALGIEWADFFADGVEGRKRASRPRSDRPKPPAKKEAPPPDFGPLLRAARALPDHDPLCPSALAYLAATKELLQRLGLTNSNPQVP